MVTKGKHYVPTSKEQRDPISVWSEEEQGLRDLIQARGRLKAGIQSELSRLDREIRARRMRVKRAVARLPDTNEE